MMDTVPNEPRTRPTGTQPADAPRGESGAPERPNPNSRLISRPEDVHGLIADIRSRMADLAARELALRKREVLADQRYRQLQQQAEQAAQQAWVQTQDRLSQRSNELDAQSVELTTWAGRLRELEKRVGERQTGLEQMQQRILEQAERVRRRSEAMRAARQKEQQTVRRRIEVVREREQDLQRRIARAHEDIVRQRQELEQKRGSIQERLAALEARENELQVREGRLEADVTRLQQRADEFSALQTQVQGERAEVAALRQELEEAARNLEAQRRQFADKQRDLYARWRNDQQQQHDQTRQADELEVRRRALEEREAQCAQRQQRLENYDEQLRARSTSLENEFRRLSELEAELNERGDKLTALTERSERALDESEQRREEAYALREQAEARDAASRQAQMAIELEREELTRQHAALTELQGELDTLRSRRESEFEEVRQGLVVQAEELRRAQRSILVRPRRWWLRSTALAIALAAGAALGWLHLQRPTYRAAATLRVIADAGGRAEVTLLHQARLNSPALVAELLREPELSRAWQSLQRDGRARVMADTDAGVLLVTVAGVDAAAAEHLARTVAERYSEQAADWPVEPAAAAALERLTAERKELADELRRWQQQQAERQQRLATLAEAPSRDEVQAAVARLRAAYDQAGGQLAEGRARLAGLESGPAPRGTVLPDQFEEALRADEMYQADVQEARAATTEYRSEVAVALLLMVDPLRQLREQVAAFKQTISEQRELRPPAPVQAVLEECLTGGTAFDERLGSAEQDWAARLDALQSIDLQRDVIELVKQQAAATDQARRVAGEANAFTDAIRKALESLSDTSDGGTREVVVAAVVRSELAKLSQGVGELARAADNTDPAVNFRIDALDRQVRRLQTRLERRQTSVRQVLQFEADEEARRNHAKRVSELRQAVQEGERGREELIDELTLRLDELRRLDGEVARRAELSADLRQGASAIADLEQRIAALDGRLAAARSSADALPVQLADVQTASVEGLARTRGAALAAAGAFALTYLICLLTVIRNPSRRRRVWDLPVLTAPLAGPTDRSGGNGAPEA
jgi:chromosome segregation ATPase